MGGWESEEETCGSRCKRRGTAAGTCLAVHGTVAGVRHVGRAFVVCTPESPRARCVQGVFRERQGHMNLFPYLVRNASTCPAGGCHDAFVVCTPESPRARCVQGVFRETRSIVLGATLATHDRQF